MHKIKANKTSARIIKELEDGLDPHVLAKQILIKGENKRIFIDYVLKIREKGHVYKKTEEDLLKKYIFSGWMLRRMREIEKNLFNKQQIFDSCFYDLPGEKKIKKRIRNLSKIEINNDIKENHFEQERLEKQMIKALKQLREEQNFHKLKE
ncbi:MAG: hypothetical protein WCI41_02125 [bacterium]